MSKQESRSKEFSLTETFKLVASVLSFLVDSVTAAGFLFGSAGFVRLSPPKPTSFHLALIIVLLALVITGLILLIGALAQRYRRLNEDEWKWKYEVERSPYTYQKRQIRLRRSDQEVEDLVYREVEKFGRVAGWIGFLPYVAWCAFTASIIRAVLIEMAIEMGGNASPPDDSGAFYLSFMFLAITFLLLPFYGIPLKIAKSVVRDSFHAL